MPQGPPRRRRARPVADAPIDALLVRAEDLAKGWLLALLEQAPLHEAPVILAGEVSRDGPRLCDAVVRALASDSDLRRIEAGGALEHLVAQAGTAAGGDGLAAASQSVDALHAVIWSALRSELADPDGEQVSDLAERLALVIEHVRGAALRASASAFGGPARVAPPADRLSPEAARSPEARSAEARSPEERWPEARSPEASPAEGRGALHVAPAPPPPPVAERPRDGERDALWKGAFYDEVERAAHSGAPLSLLVVELADADRVVSVEGPLGTRAAFGRFAGAVRSAVRRGDILARESDTRAWIIATNTGRLGAQALADRVASAVRAAEPWRGAPLGVSAGIAVFGEDGDDVPDLIDAAEEARFAAEASGVPVIRDHGLPDLGLEPEVDPAV